MEVSLDAVAPARCPEVPQNDPVFTVVYKVDADTGKACAQGGASLEGALFEVRYYAGQYSEATLPASPTRTWVLRTDKNGLAQLSASYKVSGDDFYTFGSTVGIPLGTVTVRETKAPAGYAVNDTLFVRNIVADGSGSQTVSVGMEPVEVSESVLRGGVSVQKVDAETGKASPQGGASLSGALFAIRNMTGGEVCVGGVAYADGADVKTVETDSTGYAATGPRELPLGAYSVREVRATDAGYLLSEGEAPVVLERDGVLVAASNR